MLLIQSNLNHHLCRRCHFNSRFQEPSLHKLSPPPSPPVLIRLHMYFTVIVILFWVDYEMAELTWENGHLMMHGLGLPRVSSKSSLAEAVAWVDNCDKPSTRANGMLESIVNQGYHIPKPTLPPGRKAGASEHDDDYSVPWCGPTPPPHVPVTLDALVPNTNVMGCSTRVGSCSTAARVPLGSDWSVSKGAPESTRRKRHAEDTCQQLRNMNNNNVHTSTSLGPASPENTKTCTVDDHDSVCHSRSQRERGEEEENQKQGAAKRSRVAAVHNQSERKRRDKINQRMKTLQKLVPNSNKTDKASMLDEVIEYLKQLQAQIQMLNRMSYPSMMMPLAIQQQLQMSMMGMGMMGMGMDQMNMNMNMNMMNPMATRANVAGVPPPSFMNLGGAYNNMPIATTCDGNIAGGGECILPQGSMVPSDPLSAYLACQSHPSMTMDAYSKMAAMYQQLQQQTQQLQQHHKQQQ
ncbi:hypothetical protein SOVF_049120 isoform B [Spinacia oleracea]|uniref:Transcription factor UNE10 isoform X2 n=1 Tax=Spinacia oleracea TaxID=3562 RepID=A0A9R0IHA9_SPIOL|nr:transcription factor UNE10 isoform X2 [Spinacia oleracea]KNA20816.1 hypothetical protein SOVF_049120 isoform B [Spinacia oleracea]